MITTILVWVLFTSSQYGQVVYSPMMADLPSCERLRKQAARNNSTLSECVQINVVVPK